ncbi:hypothetical protein M670_00836 [Schinkia azotoformans MEV2011]|uniref:Uncharacterized protein n=1 Tax=Schinkia azotoformans MEV2011 TaxID=1348973 RepID=A0A072NRF0_SCHAZ|nr:hypothetical protein [Schinkia azotoformans]KEF39812.1 hypothetical protein M670_00836 [Schinkia azotoformans MEV2011]MEC1697112.1 hypothetical protein [Schinkia azotoformans]MEC1715356.1 hypothetical protein [Schinkia azotoformans]MEC1724151.1 hypothetical protein [Schinkia azotoformans]MEC1740894.1 hypothetical protein [Schinkia azotoformans]
MKKLAIFLCLTLIFAYITPFFSAHTHAAGNIEFIKDTEDESIYRVNKNGVIYEYQEVVKTNKNKKTVKLKIYEVNGDKKKLVDNYKTTITEVSEGLIEVEDEEGNVATIDLRDDLVGSTTLEKNSDISFLASQTGSGGSYLVDCRYIVYSDGKAQAIMNGVNPHYKNTTKNNSDFIRFQGHADNLVSHEKDIVTAGFASFADDLIKALGAGKILSWTLIKTIVGGAVKVGPIGVGLSLWNYGSEWLDAREDYIEI